MATVHFVGGEKGGVGKSFLARLLVHLFSAREKDFYVVETDRVNPSLAACWDGPVEYAVWREDEDNVGQANEILDFGAEKDTIVNLPAASRLSMVPWLETYDVLAVAGDVGVDFKYWFVCSGSPDSVGALIANLREFEGKVPHVVVKNNGLNRDWSFFDGHRELQGLLKKQRVPVVELPRLVSSIGTKIEELRLSFAEAVKTKQLPILDRAALKKFLSSATKEIEGVLWPRNATKSNKSETR